MVGFIIMAVVLGKGMTSLLIALWITSWTNLARIVRGQVLELKESEYVLAARALGTPPLQIIVTHLLPNTLSLIIINTTFSIPSFIFAEAFLSFVGLGIQPPLTSWGAMAALGQQQMSYYQMCIRDRVRTDRGCGQCPGTRECKILASGSQLCER